MPTEIVQSMSWGAPYESRSLYNILQTEDGSVEDRWGKKETSSPGEGVSHWSWNIGVGTFRMILPRSLRK